MSNNDEHPIKYIVRNFQTSLLLFLENDLILLHKPQLLSGGLLCLLICEHVFLQCLNLLGPCLLILNLLT